MIVLASALHDVDQSCFGKKKLMGNIVVIYSILRRAKRVHRQLLCNIPEYAKLGMVKLVKVYMMKREE